MRTIEAMALADEIGQFISAHEKQLTRKERFVLGLGRAKLLMLPGERRSRQDIARDAGVSRQAIENIELRALRKCRIKGLAILAKEHLTR